MPSNRQAHQSRIFIPKYGGKLGEGFSKREVIDSFAHPGRRRDGTQIAGAWITELSDTRTAILLCSFCQPKFNPRRNKYRAKFTGDPTGLTDGYMSNGRCDDCGEMTQNRGGGKLFIAEEYWEQISQDPGQVRAERRLNVGRPRQWFKHIFRR